MQTVGVLMLALLWPDDDRSHKTWLGSIVTLTLQAYFKRIYMESSEHNGAYISPHQFDF